MPSDYTDEQLGRLCAALGCGVNSEHIDAVRSAAGHYPGWRDGIDPNEDPQYTAKAQLQALAVAVEQCNSEIDELRFMAELALSREGMPRERLMRIQAELVALVGAAALSAGKIRSHTKAGKYTGRLPLVARAMFIDHLIAIYEAATGREATVTHDPYSDERRFRGNFLDFVVTAFEPFDELAGLTSDALGSAVETQRGKRRAGD